MKAKFLLASFFCFIVHLAFAQIDNSIPTPADLKAPETAAKILTKQRLPDGTIVIRYENKKGQTMQRRTKTSGDGSKTEKEWDEANPPAEDQRLPRAGDAVGGAAAKTEGGNEAKAGALPGGNPSAGKTAGQDGLKAAGEGAKATGKAASGAPGTTDDGTSSEAIKKAAEAAKKILGNTNPISTGQTTGNIANFTLTNNNDFPVGILPQTFYIPSSGQYQSYVGRIDDGKTIPPNGITVIPVNGYCTDIHTPPVPPGTGMPPGTSWIPVGDPGSPPGKSTDPSIVTDPTNPPGGTTSPNDVVWIPIVTTTPVPRYDPDDLARITTSPGFDPTWEETDPSIIITWPGTDMPVGGTIDPGDYPVTFAPVIVEILEVIEEATDIIQESGIINTPFASNPEKERESIIQQTFWMVNGALTGQEYTKEDFTINAHSQFLQTTGKTVASLPPEQKEEVNSGIADFWNAYQTTGVVAKVISAKSTSIDPEISVIAAQLAEEYNADMDGDAVTDTKEESEFSCTCPDTIKFSFEVKRGETVIISSPNTILESKHTEKAPLAREVKVDKLKFGDTLTINAKNLEMDCLCANTSCDVTWYIFSSDKGNTNCEELDKFGSDTSIKMKTKAINKKDKSIKCALVVRAECVAEGCQLSVCRYFINLTFVDSKSKK